MHSQVQTVAFDLIQIDFFACQFFKLSMPKLCDSECISTLSGCQTGLNWTSEDGSYRREKLSSRSQQSRTWIPKRGTPARTTSTLSISFGLADFSSTLQKVPMKPSSHQHSRRRGWKDHGFLTAEARDNVRVVTSRNAKSFLPWH